MHLNINQSIFVNDSLWLPFFIGHIHAYTPIPENILMDGWMMHTIHFIVDQFFLLIIYIILIQQKKFHCVFPFPFLYFLFFSLKMNSCVQKKIKSIIMNFWILDSIQQQQQNQCNHTDIYWCLWSIIYIWLYRLKEEKKIIWHLFKCMCVWINIYLILSITKFKSNQIEKKICIYTNQKHQSLCNWFLAIVTRIRYY